MAILTHAAPANRSKPGQAAVAARAAPVVSALILVLSVLSGPLSLAAGRAASPLPFIGSMTTPQISQEAAIIQSVNDFAADREGVTLRHPRHLVRFDERGLTFTPRDGGPEWRWHLSGALAGDRVVTGVSLERVLPTYASATWVDFDRGGLVERYVAGQDSIEQQFILPGPLALGGADLVLAGQVSSGGAFEAYADGWQWHTADGAVSLGQVRAYDTNGTPIPVQIDVTATGTRIVVDGRALARAQYPVTIDPEIGANDFRISHTGVDKLYDAFLPGAAYNPAQQEYFVVWYADDDLGTLADDEYEIFGQRLNGATGAKIGASIRLSDMGPDGDPNYDGFTPEIAYNPEQNQYLVVWVGNDNTGSLAVGENEIYGQRVEASTGAEIGTDLRLSTMGPDGNGDFDAGRPEVVYNPTQDHYYVTWTGADIVAHENEVYGQLVNAVTGAEIGPDIPLSEMGPLGDPAYSVDDSAVAYNPTDGEYLVTWSAEDNHGTAVLYEFEIFGQRVEASSGDEIGPDFRITHMGPDGSTLYGAGSPGLVYNAAQHEYMLVWYGSDNTGGLVASEYEIFAQRLAGATGAVVGSPLRVSDMGPNGDTNFDASQPKVAYNPTQHEYLVVWQGDDNASGLADDEIEIYGQRLSAVTGAEIGGDLRLSDMGPDGDPAFTTRHAGVVYNPSHGQYLVIWQGEDNTGDLVDEEYEIFAQRVAANGTQVGGDTRVSSAGDAGLAAFSATTPAVAYGSAQNQYLVVWTGDDNQNGHVNNEFEIYAQRIDAATGAHVGEPFAVSDNGPLGDADYSAGLPNVTYNSTQDQFLVVWTGDDDTGELVDGEFEIYGQRVEAGTGALIGSNLRLSDMGPEGNTDYGATYPDAAYNSAQGRYLVVWSADDNSGALVEGEIEVFGQQVDAVTGAEIGGDLRLSDMGPDGNSGFHGGSAKVVYNPTQGQYLVVWSGNDDTGTLATSGDEVFGQRVEAATGAEIGGDFRLSDMGAEGNTNARGVFADAAYNSEQGQYLVVWFGDDITGALVDEEYEIYGQRLNAATGAEIGGDIRLSDMGPDGSAAYMAVAATVAYNQTQDEYLVVWYGDDNTSPLVDDEMEIFGQRVNAITGGQIGADFRLSDMGPNGSLLYDAGSPVIAYSTAENQYLVAWRGQDDTGGLMAGKHEIFGQRYAISYSLYLPFMKK
jgi:hypothetical protein